MSVRFDSPCHWCGKVVPKGSAGSSFQRVNFSEFGKKWIVQHKECLLKVKAKKAAAREALNISSVSK